MAEQDLKKFIQIANRKVKEGGPSLVDQAKASGWSGQADEVIEILQQKKDQFTDSFDAQVEGFKGYLNNQSSETILSLIQVISDRFKISGPAAEASSEPSESDPQEQSEVEEDSSGSAALDALLTPDEDEEPAQEAQGEPEAEDSGEEDFAALLEQKSVDEMSEEERAAIAVSGGEDHSTDTTMEQIASEAPEVEEEESFLDDIISESTPSAETAPPTESPAASMGEDEDFSALLEQKSVDEMSEEERAQIDVSQQPEEATSEEPAEPNESSNEEKGEENAEEDLVADVLEQKQEESSGEVVDSKEEPLGSDPVEAEPSTEASEEAVEGEEVLSEESQSTEDQDPLDILADQAEANANEDVLDDLLKDAGVDGEGDSEEPESPSETSDVDSDSNQSTDDLLNELTSESESETEENEDPLDALASSAPESSDTEEDPLDALMSEVNGGDSEANDESESADTEEDPLDQLISEQSEEESTESEGSLEDAFMDENEESDSSLTDLLPEQNQEGSEQTDSDSQISPSTDLINETQDELERDSSITQTPPSGETSVTQMLNELSEADEQAADQGVTEAYVDSIEEEDDESEESFTDLLSDVTGRKITEDDLDGEEDEGTIALHELIADAEQSLSEPTGQERILSENYKLDLGGRLLYEGPDKDDVRALMQEYIEKGQGQDLKLLKVVRKEVMRIETSEQEVQIKVKVDFD